MGRERYGVSRPVWWPCSHLHRPRASALCGDDQPAGGHTGILFQFRHQQTAAAGGRTIRQGQRLRGLFAVPHQQRRRGQRKCTEAGFVLQRTHARRVVRQGFPRTYIAGCGGDEQSENHRSHQRLRTRHLRAPERYRHDGGRD
ncbi:unknown [Bacteroides sp. CAG:633]|nr:unknown [Bacteroides sp. CAG:633]